MTTVFQAGLYQKAPVFSEAVAAIETMSKLGTNLEEKDSPSIFKICLSFQSRPIHFHIGSTRVVSPVKNQVEFL